MPGGKAFEFGYAMYKSLERYREYRYREYVAFLEHRAYRQRWKNTFHLDWRCPQLKDWRGNNFDWTASSVSCPLQVQVEGGYEKVMDTLQGWLASDVYSDAGRQRFASGQLPYNWKQCTMCFPHLPVEPDVERKRDWFKWAKEATTWYNENLRALPDKTKLEKWFWQ